MKGKLPLPPSPIVAHRVFKSFNGSGVNVSQTTSIRLMLAHSWRTPGRSMLKPENSPMLFPSNPCKKSCRRQPL